MPRKKPASKTGRQTPRVDIQRWIKTTIAHDEQVIRDPSSIAAALKCSVSGVQNAFKKLEEVGVIQQSDTDTRVYVRGPGMKPPPSVPVENSGVDQDMATSGPDHYHSRALKAELIGVYQRIAYLEEENITLRAEIANAADDASNKAIREAEARIEQLQAE